MLRKRRGKRLPIGCLGAVVLLMLVIAWFTWRGGSAMVASSDSDAALATVEQFYKFEQSGDFGSAWELFHPLMQQRFEKAAYIQKRAHIMMQDFGVKTFDFEAGTPQRLAGWKMSNDAPEMENVVEVEVKQQFHSPYGDFEIVQPCFVSKDSGTWKLLWSYQGGTAAH